MSLNFIIKKIFIFILRELIILKRRNKTRTIYVKLSVNFLEHKLRIQVPLTKTTLAREKLNWRQALLIK